MNLQKLFEIQAGLDYHIKKEKGLEGQDLLEEKILALQVELGELANELPEVFKFWSNKKNDYEKALKEYVDGLHFILSIGLELGMCDDVVLNFTGFKGLRSENIVRQFNELFYFVSRIQIDKDDYYDVAMEFFDLGEMLGFTWEEIEQAYLEKNKINHERQINGY